MACLSYTTALQFNNDGVVRLEEGNFHEARHCFKRALDTMTAAITQCGEDQHNEGEESTPAFHWSLNPRHALHEASHCGNSFVYSRALYITASKRIQTSEYTDESAAIVYNLALSFHLIGSENSSDSMEKAMQFYEIASAIRARKSGTKLEILDLAILNNTGQICVEWFNYDAARQCFSQLSDRLVLLNHCGLIDHFLEQRDCDGFVLNVMLDEPSLAAAA